MTNPRSPFSNAFVNRIQIGDTNLLILLAVVRLAVHILTNSEYGFHRDELAMLNNANYLAWGYVAYPPLTPFVGRVALELWFFGNPGG